MLGQEERQTSESDHRSIATDYCRRGFVDKVLDSASVESGLRVREYDGVQTL